MRSGGKAFLRRQPSVAAQPAIGSGIIAVTHGQVTLEWRHLMTKLSMRDPGLHDGLRHVEKPETHPLFLAGPGEAEHWEKTSDPRVT